MHKKSDIELQRAKISKIVRGLIRLQASVEADERINDLLPERLAEFDASIQNGKLKTVENLVEKLLEQ